MLSGVDRRAGAGRSANRSKVIRQAVAEYLARLERAEEEERERAVFRRHRTRIRREAAALVRVQAKL